jgi:AbrB family looped-hinge helix DNA binding protein
VSNKVTTKGQVTIPKAVRDKLGIRPGDEVDFVQNNGGFVLKKKVAESVFAKYRGTSKWLVGKNVDELIEEMRGR